ncbi:hypothetical protein D0Z00_002441 [Geotrichum galactomycetum]|uniref:Uncharacterized protein n=1 Tax=Geotrichum galactomycetum TaxID=27317 RepID=A0ACB6V433_9ASCO|nr:hypothetical protein D0Z00_002441 [Geotrichum candidum]
MTTTELYGGAITAAIPAGFVDASMFREIPDTQEVYVSQTVDDSILVDLMEAVEGSSGEEILNVHLKEIAEINNVANHEYSRVFSKEVPVTKIGRDTVGYMTISIEPARKWGREAQLENITENLPAPLLAMVLAVVRLERVSTDLLVTFNTPIVSKADYERLLSGGAENLPERVQSGLKSVEQFLNTVEIKDWSLFGEH